MKKFFSNLEIKFQRFMYGRYGVDRLYRALIWIYFICAILSTFSVFSLKTLKSAGLKTTSGFNSRKELKSNFNFCKTDGNSEKRTYSENALTARRF